MRGDSPTESGLQLVPVMAGVLIGSIGSGQIITATGRYKGMFPIAGTALAAIGMYLLSRLDAGSSVAYGTVGMFVMGLGLGHLVMQVLVLAVQNAVDYSGAGRGDLGRDALPLDGRRAGDGGARCDLHEPADRRAHGLPAAQVGSGSIDPSALQRLPSAIRDAYTGAFATDALSTVFIVAAAILLVAFLLSWSLVEEQALRQTVETAGVGEAFASPKSGDSLRELMRELSQLVGRERTRAFIQRTVDAAGLDLSPGSAWLLVQCADGRTGDPDALAADRGIIDAGWMRRRAGCARRARARRRRRADRRGQRDRAAPARGAPRLPDRARRGLGAGRGPPVNDAIERLARELAQETPEVAARPKSHCEPDHVSLKVAIDRFPDRRHDMKNRTHHRPRPRHRHRTARCSVAKGGDDDDNAAAAAGNSRETRVTGGCTAGSSAKLKAKPDDGRLEAEFEVDQENRNGVGPGARRHPPQRRRGRQHAGDDQRAERLVQRRAPDHGRRRQRPDHPPAREPDGRGLHRQAHRLTTDASTSV